MNKTSLITTVTGIAMLAASGAPLLALADSNTSVNTSASVTVSTGNQNEDAADNHADDQNEQGGRLHLSASTTGEHSNASTTQGRIEKAQERGDTMIDQRIKSLEDLEARLAKIKLLPADVLTNIKASVDTEIQALITLKAQIAGDTSTTSVKADDSSITKANRVYLLVEPKARIAAAASRIDAVVMQLTALATKLQARITAAQSAGVNVSAAVSAMTDFNAKIANAKVQADAAVAETANLKPDNGDKTILAANKAALKDARSKLVAAEQDLAAARHDAGTIAGVVKGHGEASATASTTTP